MTNYPYAITVVVTQYGKVDVHTTVGLVEAVDENQAYGAVHKLVSKQVSEDDYFKEAQRQTQVHVIVGSGESTNASDIHRCKIRFSFKDRY